MLVVALCNIDVGEQREGMILGIIPGNGRLFPVTSKGRLMMEWAHRALPVAMFAIVPLSFMAHCLITQTVH